MDQKDSSYISIEDRMRQVFQYLDDNLDSRIALGDVAKMVWLSPFYFHRIFKNITGETLQAYINRKRIERAGLELLHHEGSIKSVAFRYGFSEPSAFSRSFKKFFGCSPRDFRKQNILHHSRIRNLYSKMGQEYPDQESYFRTIKNIKKWIRMNSKVQIVNMPELKVAYVDCIGPANLSKAYDKIIQWATPKGLINKNTKMVTIYHDSFKITAPLKVRMSASILLKDPIDINHEVGLMSVPKGQYLKGSFELGINDFERAWTGLFLRMHELGYKKAEENPFEIYHNNYQDHPQKKFIVDLFIPVK